jgi:two-component sensor histidine kinase
VGFVASDEDVPGEATSLGLQVITALTEQIGGRLHVEGNGGTRCTVRFGARAADLSAPGDAG